MRKLEKRVFVQFPREEFWACFDEMEGSENYSVGDSIKIEWPEGFEEFNKRDDILKIVSIEKSHSLCSRYITQDFFLIVEEERYVEQYKIDNP